MPHIFRLSIVIVVFCFCILLLFENLPSLRQWSMVSTTAHASRSYSLESGTSGQLFKGTVIRKFPRSLLRYIKLTKKQIESLSGQKSRITLSHTKPKLCDSWVVATTIFPPSESIQKAALVDGWCVVVVADKKSPLTYDVPNIVYLSIEAQEKLADSYSFVKQLPWNHFGRKNIGYFYAILQGAQYIFDLDDDNVLKELNIIPPKTVMEMTITNCTAFNVYPMMGATKHPSWPRGFPLENIKQECAWSLEPREVDKEELVVFQSLADNDPDVDAIYRMLLPLPFHFETRNSVGIPYQVFVPYNAQASMHYKKSFWGLLLPITVHGRVSDIWRSYFTQRLLWEIDTRLAFVPPWVNQVRNPHNYIQDFQAETDLYLKTGELLRFLKEWRGRSITLPGLLEELWVELYERNYIDQEDVELMQAWLDTLVLVGYKFPDVKRSFLMNNSFHLTPVIHINSQRVFITGINGMIGSHLAKELVKNPRYEVYGLVRQRSDLASLTGILHKIKLVRGDITDAYRMKQIIEKLRPQLIMHFAAQAINGISYDIPELTLDTNIRGTLNLLEAIRQTGLLKTRFLLAGSSTEYGRTADLWNTSIPETAPLQPVSPYGVSKVAAESLALQYFHAFGLPVIVARFFIQVGVGGTDSSAIQEFSKQVAMIERGLLMPIVRHGNVNARRDMTDMRLSSPVVVSLAEKGVPGEVYNVGTGSAVSMREVLSEIIAQARVNISLKEEETRMRIYDEKVLLANVSKLKSLTQWEAKLDLKSTVHVILNHWRREILRLYPSTVESPSLTRGAIVTVFSERRKTLLESLPTWNRCLPWARKKYPVVVFIATVVSDAEQELIRIAAGELEVRFIVFEYGWSQQGDRAGGGGGPWINWLLAKEMYEVPQMDEFEYIMRFDEDIFFHNVSYLDIFQDMKDNNILVGWKQWIFDNEVGLGTGLPERVINYNDKWSESRGYNLSDVWAKVTDPASSHHTQPFIQNFPKARTSQWRSYLVAGCVEMYSASIFRVPYYERWLNDLNIEAGLRKSQFWEQEVKTLWMQTYVPLTKWKSYACALPLYHKEPSHSWLALWFFYHCDYATGRVLSNGRCDIDPKLRIC